MRIGLQVTLILVLVSVPALGILHAGSMQKARDALADEITTREIAEARLLAAKADGYVESLRRAVVGSSHHPSFYAGRMGAPDQSTILNVLVARDDALVAVTSVDLDGEEIVRASSTTAYTEPASHVRNPSFQRASLGETIIDQPTLDPLTREFVLRMWIPVELYRGEVRGVLVADARIQTLLEDMVPRGAVEGAYQFVVDASGRPIAHPDRAVVVRGAPMIDTEAVALALDRKTGTAVVRHDDIGEALAAFAPVARTGWAVIGVQSTEDAFEPLDSVSRFVTVLLIASVAGTVVVGFIFAQRLTRPLRELDDAASRLARGDLHTPVATSARNEVGNLARSFEGMRRELETLYANLERKVELRTRQLEDARQETAGLNDLLTHDISNYVMPAGEHLRRMLASPDVTPADKRRAEAALKSVDRIARLVEDVRALSQLEGDSGMREAQALRRRTALVPIIQDAVARAREAYNTVEDVGVRLKAPETPAEIDAHPLLVDVFLNLLTNAIKYSERPLVDVEIRATQLADGAPAWRVEVKDEGLGIPDAAKTAIFGRFRRLHKPIRGTSTGLGLSIAQRLVQIHGGTIHVEDRAPEEAPHGSVFVVTLPTARPDPPPGDRPSETHQGASQA